MAVTPASNAISACSGKLLKPEIRSWFKRIGWCLVPYRVHKKTARTGVPHGAPVERLGTLSRDVSVCAMATRRAAGNCPRGARICRYETECSRVVEATASSAGGS